MFLRFLKLLSSSGKLLVDNVGKDVDYFFLESSRFSQTMYRINLFLYQQFLIPPLSSSELTCIQAIFFPGNLFSSRQPLFWHSAAHSVFFSVNYTWNCLKKEITYFPSNFSFNKYWLNVDYGPGTCWVLETKWRIRQAWYLPSLFSQSNKQWWWSVECLAASRVS